MNIDLGAYRPTEMIKLGVRFRKLGVNNERCQPVVGNVSVFDAETGHAIGGLKSVALTYEAGGLIMAELKVFIAAVDVIEEDDNV